MPISSPRLRDKDAPAVHDITEPLPEPARGALRALASLYGPADATLARGRATRCHRCPRYKARCDALATLASSVTDVDAIHVDLADLRGYHYYTGAKFSVFAQDDTGAVGRLRPRRPLRRRRTRIRARAPGVRVLDGLAPARVAPARSTRCSRDRGAGGRRCIARESRSTSFARSGEVVDRRAAGRAARGREASRAQRRDVASRMKSQIRAAR